jgi:hypothetical protein
MRLNGQTSGQKKRESHPKASPADHLGKGQTSGQSSKKHPGKGTKVMKTHLEVRFHLLNGQTK